MCLALPACDFSQSWHNKESTLRDERGRGGRLVLPVGGQLLGVLVVTSKTVDTRLRQNEAELRVGVYRRGKEQDRSQGVVW